MTPAAFTSGGRTKFGPQKTSSDPQNSSAGGHSTRDHTGGGDASGHARSRDRMRGCGGSACLHPAAATQADREERDLDAFVQRDERLDDRRGGMADAGTGADEARGFDADAQAAGRPGSPRQLRAACHVASRKERFGGLPATAAAARTRSRQRFGTRRRVASAAAPAGRGRRADMLDARDRS